MISGEDKTDGVARALMIKAKGGLGNRMLSAVTGLVLAQLDQRRPCIDWRDGMYVPHGTNLYPLLFEAGWMGQPDLLDDASDVAPSLWAGQLARHPADIIRAHFPIRHRDPFLYRKLSIDLAGRECRQAVGVFWSYLPKLQRLRKRMARHPAFSGIRPDEVTSRLLESHFRPVQEVREQVDRIFAGQTGPVIGVHVRFTDRKVPLPKIIRRLEKLAARHPEAAIFLATDSAKAQDAILARFGNVITIDKALAADRSALHFASEGFADPVAEARNALVDMVALSRCQWLVHSRHSTFSVAAALMGRIPPSRQCDVDRYNPKVVIKQFLQART